MGAILLMYPQVKRLGERSVSLACQPERRWEENLDATPWCCIEVPVSDIVSDA